MIRRIAVMTVCLLCVGVVFAEEVLQKKIMYVNSRKAELFKEPDITADALALLASGDKLIVLEEGKMWYRVQNGESIGWVSKYLLSPVAPSSSNSVVEKMDINLNKAARKRASAYSTAAAARGLDDEDAAEGELQYDIEAVKKMEESSVTTDDVSTFIEEGQLEKAR